VTLSTSNDGTLVNNWLYDNRKYLLITSLGITSFVVGYWYFFISNFKYSRLNPFGKAKGLPDFTKMTREEKEEFKKEVIEYLDPESDEDAF